MERKKNKKATLVIEDIFVDKLLEDQEKAKNVDQLIELYKGEIDNNKKEKIFNEILSNFKKFINKLEFKYSTFDREDIRNVAVLAVLKAINNYQPSKGDPHSFILCYIENEVKNYILRQDLLKIPKTIRKLYFQIQKYLSFYPSSTIEEISKKFNLTPEAVEIILNLPQQTNVELSKIRSLKLPDLSLPIEDKIFLEQILENMSKIEKKIIELLFQDVRKVDIMAYLNISKKSFYSILNKIKQKIEK